MDKSTKKFCVLEILKLFKFSRNFILKKTKILNFAFVFFWAFVQYLRLNWAFWKEHIFVMKIRRNTTKTDRRPDGRFLRFFAIFSEILRFEKFVWKICVKNARKMREKYTFCHDCVACPKVPSPPCLPRLVAFFYIETCIV